MIKVANKISKNLIGSVSTNHLAITSSGGSLVADCDVANHFTHTLTETTTLSFTNVPKVDSVYIVRLTIIQDAGGSAYAFTWPANVKWSKKTAPTFTTTANAVDVFVLMTEDNGATWTAGRWGEDMGTPA